MTDRDRFDRRVRSCVEPLGHHGDGARRAVEQALRRRSCEDAPELAPMAGAQHDQICAFALCELLQRSGRGDVGDRDRRDVARAVEAVLQTVERGLGVVTEVVPERVARQSARVVLIRVDAGECDLRTRRLGDPTRKGNRVLGSGRAFGSDDDARHDVPFRWLVDPIRDAMGVRPRRHRDRTAG